jgi:hypothetical protein
MKKTIALLLIVGMSGCSNEKKETLDYAKLLKIKEAIERGSGNAIQQYGEMIGPENLANIESDPKFIEIKNQALADLNGLIEEALEKGVDKEALVACIHENGADSPICARYVEEVRSNTSPRLEQFHAEVKKFLANHADKNQHLPKVKGNCKAVHSGIFQLFIEGDTMLISRDETSQIEQFRGDVRKEKITWIDDCTYHLELVKEEQDPDVHLVGPGGFLNDGFVEIIHVTEEYYMYKIFEAVDGKEGELVDIGKVYFTK